MDLNVDFDMSWGFWNGWFINGFPTVFMSWSCFELVIFELMGCMVMGIGMGVKVIPQIDVLNLEIGFEQLYSLNPLV